MILSKKVGKSYAGQRKVTFTNDLYARREFILRMRANGQDMVASIWGTSSKMEHYLSFEFDAHDAERMARELLILAEISRRNSNETT